MFYRYGCGCVALALEIAGIHIPVVLISGCRRDPCDDQYMFCSLDTAGMEELAAQHKRGRFAVLDDKEHAALIKIIGDLVAQGQQLQTIASILKGVKP